MLTSGSVSMVSVPSDVESVKSALVLSGYGRGEWEHRRDNWTTQPDLVAEDLLAAVNQIGNLAKTASRKTT